MRSAGDMDKFITEPTALVSGSTAWLLSKVLHSPTVIKVLVNAPASVNRADLNATVAAIDAAGRAWETGLCLQKRDNAITPSAVVQHCLTTEQASDYLKLSVRRVQELAPSLDGKRIGRRWMLPAAAVREYEQRKTSPAA
jgi:hypothetical protein